MSKTPFVTDLPAEPSPRALEEFERRGGHPLDAPGRDLVAQTGSGFAPGDAVDPPVEELADHWARLWKGAPDTASLPQVMLRRLEAQPRSRNLLEIIDSERPFQLDSLVDELTRQRLAPLATRQSVVPVGDAPPVRIVQILLPAMSDRRSARLIAGVKATLADVRAAVDDFVPMRALLAETIERVKSSETADPQMRSEEAAFLEWLGADHFVLLGTRVYRYPRTYLGVLVADEPLYAEEDGLGILRDPARTVLRRGNEPALLTHQLKMQAEKPENLIVAKSNFPSRVHRRVHCDYVGVTLHDSQGKPEGEVRFLGLFTAEAYDRPVEDVPLLRLKADRVMERVAGSAGSTTRRRIRNILENYPRDELFQAHEDDLCATILGIAALRGLPRVRLFVRPDPFDRFVSALLFVPRERYDAGFGERAGRLLAAAHGGRVSAFYPAYGDAPLARIHYIIGLDPSAHVRPDLGDLEAKLAEASLGWADHLEKAIEASAEVFDDADRMLAVWHDAFGAGYQEKYGADEALTDIVLIEEMPKEADVAVRAFRHDSDPACCFRFKLYHRGAAVPLADVMPILQHMGLKALVEDGYAVSPADSHDEYWVHEFVVDDPRGAELSFGEVAKPFESAFLAAWTGRAESDGFNRLVLELGVSWREAALIRALARFRQQTGLDPSEAVQQAALVGHAAITRLLLDLFRTRFDPAAALTLEERAAQTEPLRAELDELLDAVPSLDADRALRRLLGLILAIKRTNFYQLGPDGRPKPHIAFKIAGRELADLPAPKPDREIFVCSPEVEGSHLRFGPVARGGLRWSDRRDDFRSEVLALVKAQQVKNAVIVPVGSKGGFYAKRASSAEPEQKRAAGIEAYRTFLSGMLDLTDNIDAEGDVARPPNLVIHDGDDPYLVVAADKGTAAFSDIANEVSAAHGFWLDDAFASGGSTGYDHKAMGITARGAWEAVKRHFHEQGKDIQREPFTAVGVGDMSGDVFGNGMLLSKQTRLVAAFDHRDIFIDPDPDPAASWRERKRLFELPRSSWQDYDRSKISAGGGVFSRSAKAIPLSVEMRAALDTDMKSATPAELIRAILKAAVELLYMGGIGTYVKAAAEGNAEVADKANDAVRVDGGELRAAIVGEGANLGFTQAGRIEYARAGGRINTDAIDNSAGVDSSDLEVNIKILTAALEARGELDRERRNALLAEMTDEVAELVLRHNRDQTLALSLMEARSAEDLDAHAGLIAELERLGRLDREVEGLPDAAALAALKEAGQGLSRPELAVLMAYSKLALFDAIVASGAPDDPWFEAALKGYFPRPLHGFDRAMSEHRLRREIVATLISNDLVNLAGPVFPWRLMAAGPDAHALVAGFAAALEIFGIGESWDAVHALGAKVAADVRLRLHLGLVDALRRQTGALAQRQSDRALPVAAIVERYRAGAAKLRESCNAHRDGTVQASGRPALASAIDRTARLHDAVRVIELADAERRDVAETATFFHRLRTLFGTEALVSAAAAFRPAGGHDAQAAERIIADIERAEERLAAIVLRAVSGERDLQEAFDRWASANREAVEAGRAALARIQASERSWSLGTLIVAQASVVELERALAGNASV